MTTSLSSGFEGFARAQMTGRRYGATPQYPWAWVLAGMKLLIVDCTEERRRRMLDLAWHYAKPRGARIVARRTAEGVVFFNPDAGGPDDAEQRS